ncbi:MAG: YegP family protein, partial [Lachnospiraceae bacterium]|nr:YegP family protein [Lachnospiraceae bacterium]
MGKFVISEAKKGFKFNLVAGNGEVIASSQVYKSAATAKKGVASVAANAPIAAIENQTVKDFQVEKNPKFEVYKD